MKEGCGKKNGEVGGRRPGRWKGQEWRQKGGMGMERGELRF